MLTQEYVWSDGLFPMMKVADGRPLFSTHPQMLLNGKIVRGKWETTAAVPEVVKMHFAGKSSEITVNADVTIEFDGFAWYDVQLTGETTTISKLQVIFPLTKEFAAMAVNNRRGELFELENEK